MQIHDLPVEKREKLGSAHSRRYRRAGRIPCILYGRGQENVALTTDVDSFEEVQKAHTALVRLKLGEDAQTALIREVTWNTYGGHVEHIDFVRVEMEDEVRLKVPCHFVGVPVGVGHGGDIQVVHADVEVFARADSIPSEIRVDISALDIGDGIHVEDVALPESVRPATATNDLLVHVVPPKKVAEPTEGEEGEVAEGEAPAAAAEEGGEAPSE